jgi:hypothetical protein
VEITGPVPIRPAILRPCSTTVKEGEGKEKIKIKIKLYVP